MCRRLQHSVPLGKVGVFQVGTGAGHIIPEVLVSQRRTATPGVASRSNSHGLTPCILRPDVALCIAIGAGNECRSASFPGYTTTARSVCRLIYAVAVRLISPAGCFLPNLRDGEPEGLSFRHTASVLPTGG